MYMQFEEAGLINSGKQLKTEGINRCKEDWTIGLINAGVLCIGEDSKIHVKENSATV